MRAKTYLRKGYYINKQIDAKLAQLEQMRRLAMQMTPCIDGDRVSSTRSDRMASIIANIADMEAQINAEIDALVDTARNIKKIIETMGDERYRSLLEMRYVNLWTFERIAHEMGYDYRHTLRLHGEALQVADRVVELFV